MNRGQCLFFLFSVGEEVGLCLPALPWREVVV